MNEKISQPIICGTDFSGPARVAADAAVLLAARMGAPLRLAHASEIPGSPLVHEHLSEEAQRLRTAGADLTAEVVEGTPDVVLVSLAQKHQARLLVVSSLGRRAPARWLLGSVAERTAESAPVPTLVVRDAAAFRSWVSGERPLRVLVAVDFSLTAAGALAWVAELRQFGACEITAAHAAWKPEEAAQLITGPLGLVEDSPPRQSVLERNIEQRVTRILGQENVRTVVQLGWSGTDAGIVEMALEAQADLIVIGTHPRHGLGRLWRASASRGVLHSAPMSVACVPTPAATCMALPRFHKCQRVLAAVDLNEPYGFAAPYAYGIVKPGGTVYLVHVVEPFRLTNPLVGHHYQDLPSQPEHARLVGECGALLHALAPAEAREREIDTKVEVLEDLDKAKAICAAAERFDVDLICVGSHTRPGLTAKALGSVSLAVLRGSRRPVLVAWPLME